jgi:hypothetical protein
MATYRAPIGCLTQAQPRKVANAIDWDRSARMPVRPIGQAAASFAAIPYSPTDPVR